MRRIGVISGAFCLAGLTAACGNSNTTSVNGQTGMTKSATGDVVAVVKTCSGEISAIEVTGSREGLAENKPNPSLGEFTSEEAAKGLVNVNLTNPVSPWVAKSPLRMPTAPTKSLSIQGSDRAHDAETTEVWVTSAQLKSLKPGQVLMQDSSSSDTMKTLTVSVADFEKRACAQG